MRYLFKIIPENSFYIDFLLPWLDGWGWIDQSWVGFSGFRFGFSGFRFISEIFSWTISNTNTLPTITEGQKLIFIKPTKFRGHKNTHIIMIEINLKHNLKLIIVKCRVCDYNVIYSLLQWQIDLFYKKDKLFHISEVGTSFVRQNRYEKKNSVI